MRDRRTERTRDTYTLQVERRYNGRGWPRGPLGLVESPAPTAIGFCRLCGANARRTTVVRGMFDCPDCFWQWMDTRVGEQTRDIEDYFSKS